MPRVSPRPLKKEIEKEITANLDWTISQLKSEPVAKDFLEDFLTDEERLMLAKRLAVIYLLKEGFSYGKISEALKITPVTIGKIRLISKSGKSPRPARCPQAEDGIIAREDLPLHELFFVLQTEKQLFSYFAFGYNHIWNIIPTT